MQQALIPAAGAQNTSRRYIYNHVFHMPQADSQVLPNISDPQRRMRQCQGEPKMTPGPDPRSLRIQCKLREYIQT